VTHGLFSTFPSLPLAALLGGAVTIDFDRTFIIQMILFGFLILVLKPMLFDPVLKVFEEREKRIEGARAEAREIQDEAGALLTKYEQRMEQVNEIAAEERERIRTQTSRLEAAILAEARIIAAGVVAQGRSRIESQVSEIRFDLGRESEKIAQEISHRVLGRDVR
jgi:F-type H+-transporting ATPase subunit b